MSSVTKASAEAGAGSEAGTEDAAGSAAASADVAELAQALGHQFANLSLLRDAVTHPSLMGLERAGRKSHNGPGIAYERLEFLGDRVVGLVVAQWLLERYPTEREGALAKRHAALVRRESLGRVADAIGLGAYLRLSPAEAQGGGRSNRTILGDACEAVLGAMYLDGGLEPVTRFVRQALAGEIDKATPPPLDSKTTLQEWAQGRGKPLPQYELIERSGPAHEPQFVVAVHVAGMEPVTGTGSSKRIAEKKAASALLRQVGVQVDD
ncbi:ribonuclease III [Azospirillum picis]|uniref:Ribonuclease 3 n=1 Tax=Azospirillum picis TaxID=488438 RepID=A0ABU0MTF6_9PROT|nr:ribonuclease III [Azospirillum picis]MBP2303013.1 ribonuclease-3 [Azospirillum picis]MDQ0536765.1 ribonuclease-3 [Azospirillum picis]